MGREHGSLYRAPESTGRVRKKHCMKGKERKGNERKSIYIAPFCTKVHTKRSGMTMLFANTVHTTKVYGP